MLAEKPWRAPALSATRLIGPGEIDDASAKPAIDSKRLMDEHLVRFDVFEPMSAPARVY